jgi:hypothetical protein
MDDFKSTFGQVGLLHISSMLILQMGADGWNLPI